MKNNIFRCFAIFSFWVTFSVMINSCSNNDFVEKDSTVNPDSFGFVKIEFDMPKFANPDLTNTRAMDQAAENAIKPSQIQVLVFDNDADKTFLYRAVIESNSLQVLPLENKATLTVKLSKTESPVNILVVANHNFDYQELKYKETTLKNFLKTLTYSMPKGTDDNNIWNAVTGSSTPFPLFGQKKVEKIAANSELIKIPMFRALARIDVGLLFKMNASGSELYGDEVEGLANFELTDVFVYRTYDNGYVAPLEDVPAGKPSVEGFQKRTNKPLSFALEQGSNALIREIYVPEAESFPTTANNQPNDLIHTVVIGGKYKGGKKAYYRLDFAQDKDKATREYLPILRNHRYVFNIKEVNRDGFPTAEMALKSTSTNLLDYELISWDETIHEFHVHGQHYFGLDNKEVQYNAKLSNNASANISTLKYQTNYPLSASLPLELEWENPELAQEYFDAAWDMNNKSIKITRLKTNESNVRVSEILNVKFGSFKVPIRVSQEYFDFLYLLECYKTKSHGAYIYNHSLNATTSGTQSLEHYIETEIVIAKKNVEDMVGTVYHLRTDEVNGISFEGTGTIKLPDAQNTNAYYDGKGNLFFKVRLKGTGTLTTDQLDPFSLIVYSNSSSQSSCEVTISPVRNEITIVSVSEYADNFLTDQGITYVLKAENNFGPNDDSRVKVAKLNLIPSVKTVSSIKGWLNGDVIPGVKTKGQIADILVISEWSQLVGMRVDQETLLNYMKNGGVVLHYSQISTNEMVRFLNNLLDNPTPGITTKTDGAFGYERIPFQGNEVYKPIYAGKVDKSNAIVYTDKENEAWNQLSVNEKSKTTKEIYLNKKDQSGNIAYTEEDNVNWQNYLNTLREDPVLNGPFGDVSDSQWGEDANIEMAVLNMPKVKDGLTIYSHAEYLNTNARPLFVGTTDGVSAFKYQTSDYNYFFCSDSGVYAYKSYSDSDLSSSTYQFKFPFHFDKENFEPLIFPNYGGSLARSGEVSNSIWVCNTIAWAIERAYSPELVAKKEALKNK